ncbi:MAG: hypothetical protein K8R56_08385 [Candidatus Eisenbacteria bacterium]|nr:hypothetical protein [Candidatus Eisenbacteria bacterium]
MDSKKDLWVRLKRYHFDHLAPTHMLERVQEAFGGPDASTHAFAHKLSRKLGWSTRFALQAIEEYRKFLYLGMVAPFTVTPPKVIDQVWHEHLLFTRGYREFCDQVLRRDFDHHPELMPDEAQTAGFEAQYDATCELYQEEFDRVPPAAFWGTPKFAGRERLNERREARRRSDADLWAASGFSDSTPLHTSFDGAGHALPEFGGGESGGAGGGADWSDAASDSGGAGSDSGSDGGGGSGCSSGCGGGGD